MTHTSKFTKDIIVEINYTEEIDKVLEKVKTLDFDSFRIQQFPNAKPFIGLRKDHQPVLGIRLRAESLVEGIRDKLELIRVQKNPPESDFNYSYQHTEPEPEVVDWKEKYFDLAKSVVEKQYDLNALLELVGDLEQELKDAEENQS